MGFKLALLVLIRTEKSQVCQIVILPFIQQNDICGYKHFIYVHLKSDHSSKSIPEGLKENQGDNFLDQPFENDHLVIAASIVRAQVCFGHLTENRKKII